MYQPLKLKPALKDYIWGGDRLIKDWNKSSEKNAVAESWEMSCHNGRSEEHTSELQSQR